ncbi:potassium-transporting ATPase subunit KdpA [Paramagnetospirillum marisnigri]|uniref:Potassium-transporting ATPase potassium-binding subunit n=1 Tax=Paramagnetospirillum marisnigri TaxID=1285242 RepID=A0A178MQS5_9PROT|nr:potassium-transporting ATPase subunit KdpA [Paramagnetospirillum marisnigri]OAN51327.1 potassium-transporting ATPase subunit KdpA [Paramagnetospirillum marisnigri]
MNAAGILQIVIFFAVVTAGAIPLGTYMARVYSGEKTWLDPVFKPIEHLIYKICLIKPDQEQHWTVYAFSCLVFSVIGLLLMYAVMRLQALLPLNPAEMSAVAPDLAFNTAVSFTTNTNWQNYGGESTMAYLTQMLGMTVKNFVSAATGMAVLVALVRGFARRQAKTVGNFYVDSVRSVLYVLLPLSIVVTLALVWQGMPQNLDAYVEATTLEGAKQVIAQGPVASQVAIKHLGTNGGGFFNANSAHPFENPTALTNLIEMAGQLLISAGLVFAFGRMIGDKRQARALYIAMAAMLAVGIGFAYWAEAGGNPQVQAMGVDIASTDTAPGGNMEGKEVRFGIANSAIFAASTTGTSCGAVNSMHDSFTPIGGMVPLVNIMLGEVIFGGVGAGLHGMIVFVIVAVFIAGLMVGRTPEYLGKKMEAKEVKLAVLCILIFPLSILGFGALAMVLPVGLSSIAAPGPHGLSEVLYAFTSATGNNGSAFGGLSGNTLFYNTTLAAAMLIGRFLIIVPTLAIAGSLAAKKIVPPSAGTFPTHGSLFIGLLIAVIVVIGGLTFFPVLALGPIVEHFSLAAGTLF